MPSAHLRLERARSFAWWVRIALISMLAVVACAAGWHPTTIRLDLAAMTIGVFIGIIPGAVAIVAASTVVFARDPSWLGLAGVVIGVASAVAGGLILRRPWPVGGLPSRASLRLLAIAGVAVVAGTVSHALADGAEITHFAHAGSLVLESMAGLLIAAVVCWAPTSSRDTHVSFLLALTSLATVAAMVFTLSFWDREDESLLHVTVNATAVAFGSNLADEMNVVTTKASTSAVDAFTAESFPRLMQTVVFGHDTIPVALLVELDAAGKMNVASTITSLGDELGSSLQAWVEQAQPEFAAVAATNVITYIGLVPLPHPVDGDSPFLVYATPIVNPVEADSAAPSTLFLVVALSVDEMMQSSIAPTLAATDEATIRLYETLDEGFVEVWTTGLTATESFVVIDPPTDERGARALSEFSLGPSSFLFAAEPGVDFGTPASLRRLLIMLEAAAGFFLIGLILINGDHSARRERERVRREALLAAALEGAPGWTSIIDVDGRVVMSNKNAHGAGPGTALADVPLWLGDDTAAAMVDSLVREARSGVAGSMQHLWSDPADLSHAIRIFEIETRPLPDPTLVYLQCVDVTEHRDRAMRTAQSERMEAIGVLAGGLAHDFNNLLFITLGYLQMLERQQLIDSDPQSKLYVGRAIEAVERGAVVAKSLLSFARSQPLTAAPINMAQFVDELRPLMEQALGAAHSLRVNVVGDALDVVVDPGRLSSSILNTVFNARDAMDARGTVEIRVDRTTAAPPGGHAVPVIAIAVIDTGRGMAPEVLARAFEPFFTTKQIGSGTGLGLSTVYSFAQQSGGWAGIDSTDGVGTTVTIYLPPALGHSVDDTPLRIPRAATRALVVDDESALADLVAGWLEDLGMETRVANSPEQALRVAEEYHPELLVSDANLGASIDGLELARRMVEREPALLVVFMTGFSERIRALQAAGVATLAKPFSRDDLLHSLVTHLGDRILSNESPGGNQ